MTHDFDLIVDIDANELLAWAVERWNAEVSQRPLKNVHRRAMDDTYRKFIRKLGGNPDELIGPCHDELLFRHNEAIRASNERRVNDGNLRRDQ